MHIHKAYILALLVSLTTLHQGFCAEKKFNSGHYIAVNAGFTDLESIEGLRSEAVRGINKRYTWRSLEPEPGRYDFSEIESDLTYLESIGKHLVVFFTDKTFGPDQDNPTPDYMQHATLVNHVEGITTIKWHPEVIRRQVGLCRELSGKFDANPYFEGLAYQESAPSVPRDILESIGYTPELLRDGLIELLTGSARAFPTSRIFWYMNFIPQNNDYLYDIAEVVAPHMVIMGGPDILPHRTSLKRIEDLHAAFKDKMDLFCSAQSDSYRHHKLDDNNNTKRRFHRGEVPIHPDGYVTMEEIFKYGRDKLHLDYIFWSYKTYQIGRPYPGDPQDFVFADALKVIKQYPDIQGSRD